MRRLQAGLLANSANRSRFRREITKNTGELKEYPELIASLLMKFSTNVHTNSKDDVVVLQPHDGS